MSRDHNNKHEDFEEKPLRERQPEDSVQKEAEVPRKGLFAKVKYIKSNITVEPILAGLVIPAMLAKLAMQNLNLEKACLVKLKYGSEICEPLIQQKISNLTDYEREVQKVIASIETWKSIIHTALPTIVVMFMGAWSDRTGNRKICILLPIFGEFLVSICNIISTIFFYEIPVEITMLLEALFLAATGGWVTIFLGVFSYISDITTAESRTFRVGLVNLCFTASIPIGTALSGILLKLWGYIGVFLIAGSLYLLTITYGCIYLKSNTKLVKNENKKFKVSELLSLQKDTISVVTKKREGDFRSRIILNLLVVAIIYAPDHAERLISYLFVRYRLNWDAVKYSMYSTYSRITHSLAALLSISLLSKHWGFDDSVLCLISVTSRLVGSVYINFVYTDFQMYMVPVVEFLNATTYTSLRSMASKLVPSEELGKMNSLFSLVETLAALMFDPVYATLYSRTMKHCTGAVFLLSAGMTLPAICILIWFFAKHRGDLRRRALEDLHKESHLQFNRIDEKNELNKL